MPKTKSQKKEIVKELKDNLSQQKSVVFADIRGLKVKDLGVLRKKIKSAGGKLISSKKTLVTIATKESGFEVDKGLDGQVTMIFGLQDPLKPIKETYDFSKQNDKLRILAGIFEQKLVTKDDVIILAQLPSREELLGKVVGSIASPLRGLASVLQGNLRNLVVVLGAIKK